ncbi:MAG: group II intron maturase-specific domain-containing protein [Solirubrobacteraceae bacterium]
MSRRVAAWRIHRRVNLTLDDLAAGINQVLRGWLAYFTAFYPTAVRPLCNRIDRHLVRWAWWKYKRLERSDKRARTWLKGVQSRAPELFVHWQHLRPARLAGRHEPYEPRGSRADLWGPGGEIPPGNPAIELASGRHSRLATSKIVVGRSLPRTLSRCDPSASAGP